MTLAALQHRYQDVILDGMAGELWRHAHQDFVENVSRQCVNCGAELHTVVEDGAASIEVDEEGSNLCGEDDDGNEYEHESPSDVESGPAPATPHAAKLAARDLAKLLLEGEGMFKRKYGLVELFAMAMTVDRGAPFELEQEPPRRTGDRSLRRETRDNVERSEDLGHRLTGSGSSMFRCRLCNRQQFLDEWRTRGVRGTDAPLTHPCPASSVYQARLFGETIARQALGIDQGFEPEVITNTGSWFLTHKQTNTVEGSRKPVTFAMTVPEFSVEYDGEELRWEGGSRHLKAPSRSSELGAWEADLSDNPRRGNPSQDDIERGACPSTYHEGLKGERWRKLRLVGVNREDGQLVEAKQCDQCESTIYKIRQVGNPMPGNAPAPALGGLEHVRSILQGRRSEDKCDPNCRGWDIFETDTERGTEIEACDECNSYARQDGRPTVDDADVQELPEAQVALQAELAQPGASYG